MGQEALCRLNVTEGGSGKSRVLRRRRARVLARVTPVWQARELRATVETQTKRCNGTRACTIDSQCYFLGSNGHRNALTIESRCSVAHNVARNRLSVLVAPPLRFQLCPTSRKQHQQACTRGNRAAAGKRFKHGLVMPCGRRNPNINLAFRPRQQAISLRHRGNRSPAQSEKHTNVQNATVPEAE